MSFQQGEQNGYVTHLMISVSHVYEFYQLFIKLFINTSTLPL